MTLFQLSLVLTHACNLACDYCYMGEHHAASMEPGLASRAIDLAFARADRVHVGFFGGEPMMAWDALVSSAGHARARAAASRKSLSLQMTTNGTLLTRERAARLADLEVSVAVSLDGTRAAHDACRRNRRGQSSHDAVLAGIRSLQDVGVAFDLVAVMTPENVRFLGESVELLASLGPRTIRLNPAFERDWSDEHLRVWKRELARVAAFFADRWRAGQRVAIGAFDSKLAAAASGQPDERAECGVGRWNVAVAPSGNLYPCDRLVGDDRSGRFVIGALSAAGFELVPVASMPRRGPDDPACGECEERFRCGATCACANIAETNEPHRPGGVQCWYERVVARLADEVGWALLQEGESNFLAVAYGIESDRVRTPRPSTGRRLPMVTS